MKPLSFLTSLLSAAVLGFMMAGAVQAADQGTAAEAEAMTKKAVAYIKTHGPV